MTEEQFDKIEDAVKHMRKYRESLKCLSAVEKRADEYRDFWTMALFGEALVMPAGLSEPVISAIRSVLEVAIEKLEKELEKL